MPKLWLESSEIADIRSKTTTLLRDVDCLSAPVPVERIATHLGATIRYGSYSEGNLAGMLIRGESPIIAVNATHHKNRQRFTIAHECGHLHLHHDRYHIDEEFAVFNRDGRSSLAIDKHEIEANQFAAEILMPYKFMIRDLLRTPIDLEDGENVRVLAKKYGVSVQAMTYRLANIFMYPARQ